MSLPTSTVIVGAGLMGTWHAHAVRAIGGRVTGIVDPNEGRAHLLAKRHGAQTARELGALMGGGSTTAHICTPAETHVALASLALEAGMDVLIEKPFASSLAQTKDILAIAKANGRRACPVHQFLFQSGVQRALSRLPTLGAIRHVDFVACSAGAGDAPEHRARVAREILPHPLSLLSRMLEQPLEAVSWQAAAPTPGEIRLVGKSHTVTCGILISLSGRPTRNTLRIIGERGTVHVDLFHGYAAYEGGSVSRMRKIARPFTLASANLAGATANLARRALRREQAYPGLRELIRRFYAAGTGIEADPIPPEETIAVTRAVDRVTSLVDRDLAAEPPLSDGAGP